MRKISFLLLAISTMASAQLRVGLDASREMEMKIKFMGSPTEISDTEKAEGMGLTIGYEKMLLLGMIGAGAEYNLSMGDEDGPDPFAFAYGVVKVPVGFPMVRGIIRLGTTFGHSEGVKGGTSYGFGLRVKPPVQPFGIEAHYTIHNVDPNVEDFGEIGMDVDASGSMKYFNLTMTYSF